MEGTVYHLFNTVNGKAYVGQTWDSFENRWKQHCRTDGEMVVMRAIRKHGPDAFTRTILTKCNNQKDLDAAEDAFILELDTLHPTGYNLRRGGAHGQHTAESRRKMSESHKGQHAVNEWKKGNVPWNQGKVDHLSSETKEKMRLAKLGTHRSNAVKSMLSQNNPRSQQVCCINDGKVYSSIRAAALEYRTTSYLIQKAFIRTQPELGNLRFKRVNRS